MTAPRNRALIDWYRRGQRTLPWRTTTAPWPILVSEVMAQQTQVTRVVPKFEAFMESFPTPESYGRATDREALAMWAGLGYNSRALRLREAARVIASEGWPTDPKRLAGLPGVGSYTAAAVACFAFGHQVPAVDTNLRRVVSRWVGSPLSGGALHDTAKDQLGDAPAADWNQAIMDLGASVCRPRPLCEACPVSEWCTDPDVYEAPPSQGRWEGSTRQARGAVIRALLADPLSLSQLEEVTGLSAERATLAVNDLVRDSLVTAVDNHYAIVGVASEPSS